MTRADDQEAAQFRPSSAYLDLSGVRVLDNPCVSAGLRGSGCPLVARGKRLAANRGAVERDPPPAPSLIGWFSTLSREHETRFRPAQHIVNRDRMLARLDKTKAAGADLVLFPEALRARLVILALLGAALGPPSSVAATGTVRADDPASLSVQVARWNVLHQFDRVWQTIDPRDRRVTTRNFWES